MTNGKTYNILFLCTGNSARSIIAECLLNHLGRGRLRAYSAGSHPKGRVHPGALRILEAKGYPIHGLRSKSWDELAAPGAPEMDIVITVCDDAANEVCPVWPGRPVGAHWGLPDPAAIADEAVRRRAFGDTLRELEKRISELVDVPIESLDEASLRRRLDEIGRSPGDEASLPQ